MTASNTATDTIGTPEETNIPLSEAAQAARHESAKSTVKNYVITGMAIGLVPVPLADIAALVGVQMKLVHALCKEYDVPFKENLGKSIVTSLIGGVLPAAITATLASVVKIIPGFGSLAGGASMAILGGALTYAVGHVFIHHFETGGTLIDFDPAKYREKFKEAFRKGKGVAADAKPEAEVANQDDKELPR